MCIYMYVCICACVALDSPIFVFFLAGRISRQRSRGENERERKRRNPSFARRVLGIMASAFVEAPWFKKALERVFKEIDEDGSGAADENEIYIGVLLTFNKLNSTFPFHVNPPTKNEIRELMKEFDKNRNNKLDQVRHFQYKRRLRVVHRALPCSSKYRM